MNMPLAIYKRNHKKHYNICGGIMLLRTVLKLYEQLLDSRLKDILDTTLSEAQSDFWKD